MRSTEDVIAKIINRPCKTEIEFAEEDIAVMVNALKNDFNDEYLETLTREELIITFLKNEIEYVINSGSFYEDIYGVVYLYEIAKATKELFYD